VVVPPGTIRAGFAPCAAVQEVGVSHTTFSRFGNEVLVTTRCGNDWLWLSFSQGLARLEWVVVCKVLCYGPSSQCSPCYGLRATDIQIGSCAILMLAISKLCRQHAGVRRSDLRPLDSSTCSWLLDSAQSRWGESVCESSRFPVNFFGQRCGP